MNVALIALSDNRSPIVPPLTLAYVATVLEQRRHIVRIYDLALTPDVPLATALRPLRAFCPQVVVVAGDQVSQLEEALEVLDQTSHVIPMRLKRDGLDAVLVCAEVLAWIDRHTVVVQSNVRGRDMFRVQPDSTLDQLPFPARHLLPLESYGLRAVGGELQTTLLVGTPAHDDPCRIILRAPAQIVAELRSVSREYGLRHYLLIGAKLTSDLDWLHELLTRLYDANLGVGWEAGVDVETLNEGLVVQMARAGCETLNLNLNAARVFESTAARVHLKQVVNCTRQAGIHVHADVELEPPYEAIPHLVDVAATFGLDDVNFNVCAVKEPDQVLARRTVDDVRLEALARELYDVGRSRQLMIDRFGPAFGPLLWKLRSSRLFSGVISGEKRRIGEQEDLAGSA